MLRTLGSLTLLSCIICSAVLAAEPRRATREDRGEQPRNVNRPAADSAEGRMVTVEVLIADMRRDGAAKGDAGDLSGDPKSRIQQLDKAGKLDSLTRIQLTTVDGQKATLHVGQRVARITGSQRGFGGGFGGPGGGGPGAGGGGGGVVNSYAMENAGLMLGLTPRIDRNGVVLLEIEIERSQLGPADEGPVISKPADGDAIRATPMETLQARTTIGARSGQSVVVGTQQTRRQGRQSELLIVVTPELPAGAPAPASR
jgi:Flp pilus assembly secretin CpaC